MVRSRSGFRLTIRARITLSVALLIALGGGILVAGLNVFMRFGPVWALPTSPAATVESSAELFGSGTALGDLPAADLNLYGPIDGGPEDLAIALPALEIRDVSDVFDTLLWSSLIALVVIVALGAVAAWLLAGRVLAPLHEINEAARGATPSRLDQRVGLRGPRDELTDLSDTLDEMLDRLERAFRAQQLFAANASHELRTPLATEKAMLDMLLDGPEPSQAEYRVVAERLREVNARSIAMGEALLELTRSQMGLGDPEQQGREPHELREAGELLADPLERCQEAAAARGLTVAAEVTPHALPAQPALLGRLLDNLLGNAVRHSAAKEGAAVRGPDEPDEPAEPDLADPARATGGTATVRLSWAPAGNESVLRVQNPAAPLDSETRARLHEPFVRAGGRVRAESGSGLGLAIAAAVAQAHDGTLRVLDPAEGESPEDFIVEVRLPLQPALDTLAP